MKPYKSLNHLSRVSLQIAEDHGFVDTTVGEDIALIHSEVSEAFEDFRSGHEPDELWFLDKLTGDVFDEQNADPDDLFKPCGIPSELADVLIRVLHFCGKHKINIGKAVREKMEYNKTRPFKHGKKL